MKLEFTWSTRHRYLNLRFVLASGALVQAVHANGTHGPMPARVRNGDIVEIAPTSVAYGARQMWSLRVLVDEVVFDPMKGLTIRAIYDDTISPDTSEVIVEQHTIPAQTETSLPKELQIPARAT